MPSSLIHASTSALMTVDGEHWLSAARMPTRSRGLPAALDVQAPNGGKPVMLKRGVGQVGAMRVSALARSID